MYSGVALAELRQGMYRRMVWAMLTDTQECKYCIQANWLTEGHIPLPLSLV